MRIIVDINHPGHVHFFRHFISESEKAGHEVLVTASSKDITFELLNGFNIKYKDIGTYGKGLKSKIINLFKLDVRMLFSCLKFKPDVILGIGTIRGAHVGWILRIPVLVFTDTEHAKEQIALYLPFATKIYTPWCFQKDFGPKHVRYKGFHELAYLHKNWFKPDPNVLKKLNLTENDRFFVLRFIAWDATHDAGHRGLSNNGKIQIINALEKYGKVFITSENALPQEFLKYRINIPSTEIHSLLYYADLFIGESGTMATESVLLGTPCIRVSTISKLLGNFNTLKNSGLVYLYDNEEEGLNKLNELLTQKDLKNTFSHKVEEFLKDKIDVTKFMLETVEEFNG